ncbi:DUF4166 domain-containing protein [Defluviimonas aestuarii]|uniref:SDR family oxidoreductase n=1 Tax=Albidovulum aestuarii TaxID=1130726 RepID=UPI00249BC768|nr:SDR family oxidoreductase [Defluviimonas aestuarii]MDI3336313.1 DUF4166 domain-containing protein [Defluviimonas aestuarii]
MRVVILGGTGVFGSRLAALLARDGHEVVVAARTFDRAEEVAARLGARALRLDRDGDLSPVWAVAPEAVVDAAGPFHAYGDDPYRLARACIAQGIAYLDLADDPDFCAGIAVLDAEAKAAGVFALSGVSSVPALSSAAVATLAEGMERIEDIDMAILPGNRAPRGTSVIAAILDRTGATFRLWQGGAWEVRRGWSDVRRYRLAPDLSRAGYLLEVPDIRLFPNHFKASSVSFRAGLELWPMNAGLAVLSLFRSAFGFAPSRWTVRVAQGLARLLSPFGSDRGGMVVRVSGRRSGAPVTAEWRLVAEAGDGPFVPTVAARAMLARTHAIAAGARPALAELPLAAFEGAMVDIAVTTEREDRPSPSLFLSFLGRAFLSLPKAVRDSHDWTGCLRLSGRATIVRGTGLPARIIALIFGFPPSVEDVAVTVTKRKYADGEIWVRDFGGRKFRSHLRHGNDGMTESFGPFEFTLALAVRDGALTFPVASGRIGPLRLPRAFLPLSFAVEREEDGRFQFDVDLHAPLGLGRIVHYRGWLIAQS